MEKLIKELKKGQMTAIFISMIMVIAILLVGVYQIQKQKTAKGEFNKNRKSEDTVSVNLYYLMGPVAEAKEGSNVTKECYIGIGEDEAYVILTAENNRTGVPIYDENMTEEEIDNLKPVTIVGKSKKIETDLAKYLISTYNEIEDEDVMTLSNYTNVFGKYCLDTDTASEDNELAYALFFIDVIIVIIVIISFSAKNKENKKIKEKINEYKESGEIEEFDKDIENSKSNLNKKLKVLITDKYIYNFKGELYVIPIDKISNAYTSCIMNNEISKFDYIAIETKENETYFIAAKERNKKNKNFDKLLNEIKGKIK